MEKAKMVQDSHAQVKANIERKVGQCMKHANKARKEVIYQSSDWVWLHLRKERFPTQRKSKLHPRGDGPFKVLRCLWARFTT